MLASLVPLALSACDRENEPIAAEANEANAIALDLPANGNRVEIQRWLARLRHATSGFHEFERATTAGGYSVQITQCMTQPPDGGMGFHYGNPGLIDGLVEPLAPEALLYEPQRNGEMRLVAVEFVVPFTAWTESVPPSLFGIEFKANQTFQVWALHAWIWRNNPAGMFADWNPRVDCSQAQ
jgi:hypothetical protein